MKLLLGGRTVRETVIFFLMIAFPLLVLYDDVFRPWIDLVELPLFMGVILVLALLLYPLKSTGGIRSKLYLAIDLILMTGALAAAIHIMTDWRYIVDHLGRTPRPIDIILGATAVIVTLEATRRTMFPLVPICLAFLLYTFFGQGIGGFLGAAPFSLDRFFGQLYLTHHGLYGMILNVSIKFIVPFLVMGSLLKAMGAMDVLGDLVNKIVGRTAGGPAKISTVSSGMFGMMSGSAVANVAFTGTFTIPLMKRYGYKPEFAGAVEAAASTGGQLMPPIMGAAAFIMADYTGIPYVKIIIAAFIPAVLYYTAIFSRVHFMAKKAGLQKPSEELLGRIKSLKEIAPRLIPLLIIFGILMTGLFVWTPTKAAVLTIAAIIPLSWLRPESRLTPRKIIDGLVDATRSYGPISAATIAMGILIATADVSGLGLKFSELMTIASAQNLGLLLLVTAVACIIMGMGIGGVVVYVFCAVMIAPALIKLGIPLLAAHLFIFYFAQIQSITPPVCMASYTAATIAKANMTKTALLAVSIGFIGLIMPFLFILHPELLMQGDPISIIIVSLLMGIGTVSVTIGFSGYLNRRLTLWERALFFIASGAIFIIWNYALVISSLIMIGLLISFSIMRGRRKQVNKIDTV